MTTRQKKPAAKLAGNNGFSLISNDKLRSLYASMLHCRMIREHLRLLPGQRLAILNGAGDEAATVAVTIDLRRQDSISPAQGSLLEHLLNEGSLEKTSRRRRMEGLAAGCIAAKSMRPSATVTVQFTSAINAARRSRQAKSDRIVTLFCGCEQPAAVWRQCLQSAATEKLPILFICHSSADAEDFAPKTREYGLPAITVDAADAVAIYRVATEAIAHARRGNGPTLIECKPWIAHKPPADPIRTMEKYLAGKGLFGRKFKTEIIQQLKAGFPFAR